MRGEECGESSLLIVPNSEGEVNMDDRELLIVIRTMAEKIGMLEWDNEQLRKRIADTEKRYEQRLANAEEQLAQVCKAAVMEVNAK